MDQLLELAKDALKALAKNESGNPGGILNALGMMTFAFVVVAQAAGRWLYIALDFVIYLFRLAIYHWERRQSARSRRSRPQRPQWERPAQPSVLPLLMLAAVVLLCPISIAAIVE